MSLSVVWFKRDLRVQDHAPLCQAVQQGKPGDVVALYLFEPTLMRQPDFAAQHLAFTLECLADLHRDLERIGVPLLLAHTDAVPFFDQFARQLGSRNWTLWSHEETGNWASYQRDIALRATLQSQEVAWLEFPSNGVVRRLQDRDAWSRLWDERMYTKPLKAPMPNVAEAPHASALDWYALAEQAAGGRLIEQPWQSLSASLVQLAPWAGEDKAQRQQGGRRLAEQVLQGFLQGDALARYREGMSSPLTAPDDCSRLSAYIAYGVLSVREVLHAVWQRRTAEQALPREQRSTAVLAGLKSFESRLHWHCHFIQKLESEPALEFRCASVAFEGVRNAQALTDDEQARLDAWIEGKTGFPMIDACMRMLRATGWINFRMRAMLVSFASYHLWLDWRHTAPLLAKEFLDYEPGIHYPQFQMQSGVTGINTLRIYNPVKQAEDQDPDGVFIRQWIPELADVPTPYLPNPWTMPGMLQLALGCQIGELYPMPVVDHEQVAKQAREQLWALQQSEAAQALARTVYHRHGSRNPQRDRRSTGIASRSSLARGKRQVSGAASVS